MVLFLFFFLQVVRKRMQTKCKCHGVSATCTTQTCWRQLSPFHDIGRDLKKKYENAARVAMGNTANAIDQSLRIRRRDRPPPPVADSNDMVYIEHSPDFCSKGQYSYGTAGRICNKTSNCDSICCGRGYNIRNSIKTTACNCKFNWCCDVICSKCTEREEVYSCKSWSKIISVLIFKQGLVASFPEIKYWWVISREWRPFNRLCPGRRWYRKEEIMNLVNTSRFVLFSTVP